MKRLMTEPNKASNADLLLTTTKLTAANNKITTAVNNDTENKLGGNNYPLWVHFQDTVASNSLTAQHEHPTSIIFASPPPP